MKEDSLFVQGNFVEKMKEAPLMTKILSLGPLVLVLLMFVLVRIVFPYGARRVIFAQYGSTILLIYVIAVFIMGIRIRKIQIIGWIVIILLIVYPIMNIKNELEAGTTTYEITDFEVSHTKASRTRSYYIETEYGKFEIDYATYDLLDLDYKIRGIKNLKIEVYPISKVVNKLEVVRY